MQYSIFKKDGKLYNQKVTCISLVDQIKKKVPHPTPSPNCMHLIFRQKFFDNVSSLKMCKYKNQ